jgi:hypothetical protein
MHLHQNPLEYNYKCYVLILNNSRAANVQFNIAVENLDFKSKFQQASKITNSAEADTAGSSEGGKLLQDSSSRRMVADWAAVSVSHFSCCKATALLVSGQVQLGSKRKILHRAAGKLCFKTFNSLKPGAEYAAVRW